MDQEPSEERSGVVSPRRARLAAFWIITTSLVAATVTCILAVWDVTHSDTVWKALATMAIVSFASGVFLAVNERFSV